jgi:predicted ATP-dependent endonuclease of OLD family
VLATLASLRIRNLALVEELAWSLLPGFTAVTGETGSGKSIIVGALQLILGERADKTLIRTGAESCTVEAVFDVRDVPALNARLEEQGVEPCEEAQLILKRVFSNAGSNRQFINGSPTTLAVLKELGDSLVDLHGPHDHQSLLSNETQLALLDAFANAADLGRKFGEQFRKLNSLIAEHTALAADESALEREVDLLRHQVREIEAAELRVGEEEELLARYGVATNSRRCWNCPRRFLAASRNRTMRRWCDSAKSGKCCASWNASTLLRRASRNHICAPSRNSKTWRIPSSAMPRNSISILRALRKWKSVFRSSRRSSENTETRSRKSSSLANRRRRACGKLNHAAMNCSAWKRRSK